MPFQQRQPCTTTSTQVKGKPANLIVILLAHSLLLELIMLLFLNWGDLQGHSTSLKICSKVKYFRIKCTIHNVAWHAYGTCKYAGSHMHPKHYQQETSLNMKGGGDNQNLEDRRFLEVQIAQMKKNAIFIEYWEGERRLVSSHTLYS